MHSFQDKKSQLINSVKNNDVESLKKLLDSPEWYHTTDPIYYPHNSLLQKAIVCKKEEVFDYMLSLEGFPLETRNSFGKTALQIALEGESDEDEYFATELIKKGADFYPEALLQAADAHFVDVVEALLERGADPNVQDEEGKTALHRVYDLYTYKTGLEAILLAYGADPLLEDRDGYHYFEWVLNCLGDFGDNLENYVIDEHCSLRLRLLRLTDLVPEIYPRYYEILNYVDEIIISNDNTDYLENELVVGKQWFVLAHVLLSSVHRDDFIPFTISTKVCLDNFNSFVEDFFDCSFEDFVSTINSSYFFKYLYHFTVEESAAVEVVCHLLSHGMTLNSLDFSLVYEKYGFGELLKIMLYMDFDTSGPYWATYFSRSIIPIFITLFDLDIDTYLQNPKTCSTLKPISLMDYWIHPKLTQCCDEYCKLPSYEYSGPPSKENLRIKLASLPKILPLKQLSRDLLRKYLIEKYKIKSAREFYTRVNRLQINNAYKKIITYETKLY